MYLLLSFLYLAELLLQLVCDALQLFIELLLLVLQLFAELLLLVMQLLLLACDTVLSHAELLVPSLWFGDS